MIRSRLRRLRPGGEDLRAAAVEFGLTTAFMTTVFGLVRGGIGSIAPGAPAGELRIRVVLVSGLVGLVIVGFALSRPGRYSGAHMNPAITLGLIAAGSVPARRVLPYLAGQGAGSLASAAVTGLVCGPGGSGQPLRWAVVQPGPGWGGGAVAVAEAATLAVIVAVMCWLAARRPGWPAAWVVGGLFALQGAMLGTATGGSANPARQLGPALLSGDLHLLAVYLIAPVVGGTLAGAAARRLRSPDRVDHPGTVARLVGDTRPGQILLPHDVRGRRPVRAEPLAERGVGGRECLVRTDVLDLDRPAAR
jgi:glycerol uptake facilitator-like aquaporin